MRALADLATEWPALSALLDEALALPGSQRAAWLDALQARPEVTEPRRDALRQLLAWGELVETDDFLSALPPLHAPAAMGEEPTAEMQIGPYRLISELGHGGMGTVWLAERVDGQPRRRVALKLPRLAWGSATTQRLQRERDILAALEHPHIARLYDAGADLHGRPYLAMEWVEGQPIDAYARDRSLSVRQRVGLLLQVCEAVAHAHSRLVVHRDLKPSNILVTAESQVRLLDFGVAKLLDGGLAEATALTREAGRAMTLDYASPEQLAGAPLGTASDVYSLGVVAFELLAGRRPYRLQRGTAAELEAAIALVDAPRASDVAESPSLKTALRGDLDAILGKALSKASADRYVSVELLAQDLRRHLDGETVLAQPPTFSYRLQKFVRRYRLQVTAATFAGLALVGGATLALWQAKQAREQAALALRESATAVAVQNFIESVFRANSANQADPRQAREATARELLDRGAERIGAELRDAPAARLRLLALLSEMYENLGVHDRSLQLSREALALARQSTGPQSEELLRALVNTSRSLVTAEQLDEARRLLDEAKQLGSRRADLSPEVRMRLSVALAWLDLRADPAQGLAHAEQAIAIGRTLPMGRDMIESLAAGAYNALYSGKAARSRELATEAIAQTEARPEIGGADLSGLHGLLGDAQGRLGELEAAVGSMKRSLELSVQRDDDPFARFNNESRLANFYFKHGLLREGLAMNAAGYAWALTQADAPQNFGPLLLLATQGRLLVHLGRLEEGLAVLDRAVAVSGKGDFGPDLRAPPLLNRARALVEMGRTEDAERSIQAAEALLRSGGTGVERVLVEERRHWEVATGRAGQALAAWRAERQQRQLPELPAAGESPAVLAESAWLHQAAGQATIARAQAELALVAIDGSRNQRFLRRAEARAALALGRSLLDLGAVAEALPMLERAVQSHQAVFDPERSPELAQAWISLAQARALGRDTKAARDAAARAERIHANHPQLGEQHRAALRAALSAMPRASVLLDQHPRPPG